MIINLASYQIGLTLTQIRIIKEKFDNIEVIDRQINYRRDIVDPKEIVIPETYLKYSVKFK